MATDLAPELGASRAVRERMVTEQLVRRGIHDRRVLRAMGAVPREAFVPHFLRPQAYSDRPLLIGYEQTISQPYIVALMTEALGITAGDRVLEIGTGSGYQTAVLAELGAEVYSVERLAPLSLRAERALDRLGYDKVRLRVGDGTAGWPDEAPFDAIVVTAGATSRPRAYREQLNDGGRLVIPVGPVGRQTLHRLTRRGDDWDDEELGSVAFVPLVSARSSSPPKKE